MHGSITDKIPESVRSELRANATATLGAYRRATLEVAPGASLVETRDTIARVLADGANLHNKKGAARLSSRIQRALSSRFLTITVEKADRRYAEAVVGFYTIEPSEMRLHNLQMASRVGRPLNWHIEHVCRVSRHAVARFIERSAVTEVTLEDIAIASLETLRFAREVRKLERLASAVIPVPDARCRLIAICNVTEGEVITFVDPAALRGERAEWFNRFAAFDSGIAEVSGASFAKNASAYATLLNEGARVWEQTRRHCAA